jgi:hypothetical protein
MDLALRCGPSRRRELLFVHHYIEPRRANLAAFRVGPAGLEHLYSVPAPRDVLLAQDAAASELVCLWDSCDRLEISVLGPEPPTFDGGREGRARSDLPFLDTFLCHSSRGGGGEDGDGDAASDLLDAAHAAACRGDWHQVRALLDGVPPGSDEPRRIAHHHHLLGLAHLRTGGTPDRAREVWKAGTAHDLRDSILGCRLDACLELVEPLPDPLPVEWWDSRTSLVRQLRGAIAASDALMAEGDVRGALRILRCRAVTRTGEVQTGARLASAWLAAGDEPAERFDKAIALSRFVALAERRGLDLPIQGAWDGSRIAAVAALAAAWLADW